MKMVDKHDEKNKVEEQSHKQLLIRECMQMIDSGTRSTKSI